MREYTDHDKTVVAAIARAAYEGGLKPAALARFLGLTCPTDTRDVPAMEALGAVETVRTMRLALGVGVEQGERMPRDFLCDALGFRERAKPVTTKPGKPSAEMLAGLAFARAVAVELGRTVHGQRVLADWYMREDAARCPAFAAARAAAVNANVEFGVAFGCESVPALLDALHKYERLRGGGALASEAAAHYACVTAGLGWAAIEAYESARKHVPVAAPIWRPDGAEDQRALARIRRDAIRKAFPAPEQDLAAAFGPLRTAE